MGIFDFLDSIFGEDEPKRYPRKSYKKKKYKKKKYKSSGKTYVDDNGYLRYLDSDLLVHRVEASKKLGRRLRKEEVVHHKNRNKLDNRWKNLWVFRNQDEHDEAHEDDEFEHGIHSYTGYGKKKIKFNKKRKKKDWDW